MSYHFLNVSSDRCQHKAALLRKGATVTRGGKSLLIWPRDSSIGRDRQCKHHLSNRKDMRLTRASARSQVAPVTASEIVDPAQDAQPDVPRSKHAAEPIAENVNDPEEIRLSIKLTCELIEGIQTFRTTVTTTEAELLAEGAEHRCSKFQVVLHKEVEILDGYEQHCMQYIDLAKECLAIFNSAPPLIAREQKWREVLQFSEMLVAMEGMFRRMLEILTAETEGLAESDEQ
jgi:hypothetical protein